MREPETGPPVWVRDEFRSFAEAGRDFKGLKGYLRCSYRGYIRD